MFSILPGEGGPALRLSRALEPPEGEKAAKTGMFVVFPATAGLFHAESCIRENGIVPAPISVRMGYPSSTPRPTMFIPL